MAFINWNDSLSVKIDSIDKEHKILINMINNFYDNIKSKSSNELISALIKEMKEYTVIHFKTEEDYMKKFNFSGYVNHKKEHDTFVTKVIDLEKRFNKGDIIISFEVTNFLKDWLKNHIMITDHKYIDFLLERGVK